jgi:hypothetical protein
MPSISHDELDRSSSSCDSITNLHETEWMGNIPPVNIRIVACTVYLVMAAGVGGVA